MTSDAAEPSGPGSAGELEVLLLAIESVRASMVASDPVADALAARAHPDQNDSARNLVHYLALRRHDLRPLQRRLSSLGLSSLGRAESNVLGAVDAVIGVLRRLCSRDDATHPAPSIDLGAGEHRLATQADALLGRPASGRDVRIMVTMPGEAAFDYERVLELLRAGMDCARINCAHDDAAAWAAMIGNLRRAGQALGRQCRVVMDLAGPKLRTGPLEPGPSVVRIRPARDVFGRVIVPARVRLVADAVDAAGPAASVDACLPVDADWLARVRPGDRVRFTDARGARRTLEVESTDGDGCCAMLRKTAYVVSGTRLRRHAAGRLGARDNGEAGDETAVLALPAREGAILLHVGDRLLLDRDPVPGRGALLDPHGQLLAPARIGCTLAQAVDRLRIGDAVWFDDGRIGSQVESVSAGAAMLRITHARPGGARLRAGKGINLPDTDLGIPAITDQDIEDLEFAVAHADAVELSFANSAEDVELLHQHLLRLQRPDTPLPAVVLKIETRRGFDALPAMLLAAMRSPVCGVMIARGDLAVECGFERLAELQEEILWICEAARVPVIWATQVLESLARDGMPSRAEITDAAMAHRAECVMLNKGPHIVDAVRLLDDILRRMQAHQRKKRSMLRELRLAHSLSAEAGDG